MNNSISALKLRLTLEEQNKPQFCSECEKTKTRLDFYSENSKVCRNCCQRSRYVAAKRDNPFRFVISGKNGQARRRVLPGASNDLYSDDLKPLFLLANGICAYCGLSFETLSLEHCIPLSRGGDHDAENVVFTCRSCNSQKRDKTPSEYAQWLLNGL